MKEEGTGNISSVTRAAKSLFKTLSPDGSNLKRKNVENILHASETTSHLWNNLKKAGLIKILQSGDDIGESEFISIITNYEKGVIPTEPDFDEDDDDYDDAKAETFDFLKKLLKSSANYVLDKVMKNGTTWLRNVFPTSQLQTLLLIMLYSLCTVEMLLIFLPLLVGFLAFSTMVINSLQAFAIRRLLHRFGIWSDILEEFEPDELDRKKAESLFNWNTVRWPVISFSLATIAFIFSFSLVDSVWVPYSEFTVIAIYFTLSTHRWLVDSRDWITTLSLILQCSVVLTSKLEFPSIFKLLNKSLLTLEVAPGLNIHIGFSSLLYLCSLALLVYIAARNYGRDFYQVFLPHLMSVLWLRVSLLSAQGSTIVGLIRGSVGWALLILLSPLALLYFFLYLLKWLLSTVFGFQILVTFIMIIVLTIAVVGITDQLKSLRENRTKVLQVFLVLVITLVFFSSLSNLFYQRPSEVDLEFFQYQSLCGKKNSSLTIQNVCHHLSGKVVRWKGRVSETVRITQIENRAESVLQKLPQVVANQLRCIYGMSYPECHVQVSDDPLCTLKNYMDYSCHLQNYDTYTFSLSIAVDLEDHLIVRRLEEPQIDVILVASNKFKSFLWDLKIGNLVKFMGKIKGVSALPSSQLELIAIDLPDSVSDTIVKDDNSFSERLVSSLYFTLNNFVSPLFSVHI